MKEFDPEASRRLEHYLDQMRVALRGSRSVDPEDVETDVAAHIQSELAGVPGPVTLGALDAVLERLGSPLRWVPEEEQSAWRRVLTHLRAGPEDWRLAYLSLGAFLCGLVLVPSGPAAAGLLLISYLMARAVLTLFDEQGESLGAQKWFVYPVLVLVHGLALCALLALPLFVLVGAADAVIEIESIRPRVPVLIAKHAFLLHRVADTNDYYELAVGIKDSAHVLLGVLGPWLVLLGICGRTWPALPGRALRPLLARFRRQHAGLVLLTGVVLCVLSLVFYAVNS